MPIIKSENFVHAASYSGHSRCAETRTFPVRKLARFMRDISTSDVVLIALAGSTG